MNGVFAGRRDIKPRLTIFWARLKIDGLPRHFDRHHHALVFVFHHVAMKYEAPDNFRISEKNNELCLAWFPISLRRNAERVAKPVEIGRSAVYFRNQESGLMNMKVMILGIFV